MCVDANVINKFPVSGGGGVLESEKLDKEKQLFLRRIERECFGGFLIKNLYSNL